MAVKAKFYVGNVAVASINEDGSPKYGSVTMQPVCRGAVNKRWASATPSGTFTMQINSPALAWFMARVGKELSITVEDASADPATHQFVPLEDDLQPSYGREESCVECGHPQGAHAAD